MVRKNNIERRFLKQLNEIEEQARNIKKMVNCGYLNTVSCNDEMDSGFCWLKDLKEAKN